jgi:hypothetical protein
LAEVICETAGVAVVEDGTAAVRTDGGGAVTNGD